MTKAIIFLLYFLTIFFSFQIPKSRRIHFSTAEPQVFIVERLDISDIVSPLILHRFLDAPPDQDEDHEPEELLFDLEL